MKKGVIIFLIWASGALVSYWNSRRVFQNENDRKHYTHWSKQDRVFVLGISVLSWATVIASEAADMIFSTDNLSNVPASW